MPLSGVENLLIKNIPAYKSASGRRTFLYRAISAFGTLYRTLLLIAAAYALLRKIRINFFDTYFSYTSYHMSTYDIIVLIQELGERHEK